MRAREERLLALIEEQFDKMTDKGYQYLIKQTLNVYVNCKPQTKEESIADIKRFYQLFGEGEPVAFLLQSKPFDFRNDIEKIFSWH